MTLEGLIRPAEWRDVDRIVEILVEVELAPGPDTSARVRRCFDGSRDTCFVSEDQGVVDGVALSVFNGFHLFLGQLAVAPTRRKLGIGRSLHERLEKRGREIGALGIIADARLTSVGFFQRLGYRLPGAVFLIEDLAP